MHKLWLAIKYLWSDNGPIKLKRWPKDSPVGWVLTQEDIVNAKKNLSTFLIDI